MLSLGADTLSFIVMLLPLLTDDFPLSLTIGANDAAFCEGFVTVTFTSGTAGVSEGVKSGSFVGFSEGDGVTSGESVAAGGVTLLEQL